MGLIFDSIIILYRFGLINLTLISISSYLVQNKQIPPERRFYESPKVNPNP
jgi:hypothetical protein